MNLSFVVSDEQTEERIDKLLVALWPAFSRSYFHYLIEQGAVLLNGLPVKKRLQPKAGDRVEVAFLPTPEISLEPQEIPLDILFEDGELLVVHKPAGMTVHPAPGSPKDTLANALLFYCKQLGSSDALRPGIVHRLDKETSGVLVVAKTSAAHQRLVALFAARKVEKRYLALCVGRPQEGRVEAPIGRHPVHRQQMAVVPSGREATSWIQPLAFVEPLTYVEVRPVTGRTHQIRVHLKHLGCPILGDSLYGNPSLNRKYGAERQLLHAHTLRFEYPFGSGAFLEVSAPLSADFQHMLSTHFKM